MKEMTFEEFAERYCAKHSDKKVFHSTLKAQHVKYAVDGWMLLEAVDMSSSWLGSLVVLPYGANNTYKAPPAHPISPRGLASDMSVVIGILPNYALPGEL